MGARSKPLDSTEIRSAFAEDDDRWPPMLRPQDLAQLARVTVKTVYFWLEEGRLEGAARKRCKHWFIWRDRAIDIIFNGPSWATKTNE